jgi:hypothetical protein
MKSLIVLCFLSALSVCQGMSMQQLSNKMSNSNSYNNNNNNKNMVVGPAMEIPYDEVKVQAICPNKLNGVKGGCTRYTRGFDVTGVVTEVDLTFPQVKNACECINACLARPNTCAAYVYKFSTPQSVLDGYRTCTLYSQFNLPTNVTLTVDTANSMGFALLQPNNNPQKGGAVPQTFKDFPNLNTTADNDAVSGPVWQLANGHAQC